MPSQLTIVQATLVVVDPMPDDYHVLLADASQPPLAWAHFASAGELLRAAYLADVRWWIVHADLPDARGIDLVRQLAKRRRLLRAAIVTDRYSPAAELEVLASGLAHYACKPLSPDWLGHWLGHLSCRHGERRLAQPRCPAPSS